MKPPFTRAERRMMRACAKTAAPILARGCIDHNAKSGDRTPITDPLAIEALQRAFHRLLIEGGSIQVMALSDKTASAFPTHDLTVTPAHAKAWLAVGLDVDGRGTFALRHISTPFAGDPTKERRAVEAVMQWALTPHLARSGFEIRKVSA